MHQGALTGFGAIALGMGGLSALSNWWAVSVGNRKVEWVAKPLTMVALIVAALAVTPVDGAVRVWVVVGLVFSLAGDVFLMLPRERFVEGLGSFLVAHVAYVVAFAHLATSLVGAVVGVVVAAMALGTVGRLIVRSVRRDEPSFGPPVVVYMVVISAMVVVAWSTAAVLAVIGAMSFFVSDGVLAVNKFVRPLPAGRFAIMSTYHVAQFCFVVALIR